MRPDEQGLWHAGPRIGDYLRGELPPAGDQQLEVHLLYCAECRAEADSLSAVALTLTLLANPPQAGLPIGRARQWSELTGLLQEVCARRGGVGWLEGDAGAGTTALLKSFVDLARNTGCVVLGQPTTRLSSVIKVRTREEPSGNRGTE